MSWSKKDLERLQAEGKIKGFTEIIPKTNATRAKSAQVQKSPKTSEKNPKALRFLRETLESANIAYEVEYVFAPGRKFRFDIAIPSKLVAVEYEGLMSKKSRHTTVTGYTKDASKYNLAQSLGWRVYRYTTLNYKNFDNDLKNIMKDVSTTI